MTAATIPAPAGRHSANGSVHHRARRLYIDSGQEAVVYLHRDSELCRSEGFESQTRVWVRIGSQSILATLNVITGDLLAVIEVGLSESAWTRLGATDGSPVLFAHPLPLDSLRHVRGKIHGQRLDAPAFNAVIEDIAAGYYSDLHLAAFLTACAGDRLDRQEIVDLTRSMIATGERLLGPGARPWISTAWVGCRATERLSWSCRSLPRPVS